LSSCRGASELKPLAGLIYGCPPSLGRCIPHCCLTSGALSVSLPSRPCGCVVRLICSLGPETGSSAISSLAPAQLTVVPKSSEPQVEAGGGATAGGAPAGSTSPQGTAVRPPPLGCWTSRWSKWLIANIERTAEGKEGPFIGGLTWKAAQNGMYVREALAFRWPLAMGSYLSPLVELQSGSWHFINTTFSNTPRADGRATEEAPCGANPRPP